MIKNFFFHSLFSVALVSLVFLGIWQIQRLEWKTNLLNLIKDGQSEEYIDYPFDEEKKLYSYKKSLVSGKIDHSNELHFFNINNNGQSGYNIIIPLISNGKTIYVDLGWTSFTNVNKKEFQFRSLKNVLNFKGILIYSKDRKIFSPIPDVEKNNWYLMNVNEMNNYTNLNGQKYILKVLDQEYYADLLNEFSAINIPNNHLQYAITWFALALAIACLYVTFIYQNIYKK
ncbi:MAG: SURF1 family protein [Candidatus Pelagibacterales bacterium]|mgnify:FL=1